MGSGLDIRHYTLGPWANKSGSGFVNIGIFNLKSTRYSFLQMRLGMFQEKGLTHDSSGNMSNVEP